MAVLFLLTDRIERTANLRSLTPQGATSEERQAYMDGVNAAGGVEAWALPNGAQTAYYLSRSPILVKHFYVKYVTNNNPRPAGAQAWSWPPAPNPHMTSFSVYMVEEGTDAVTLPIYKNNGDTTPWLSLTADAYNGVADFDVSIVAQSLLSDNLVNMEEDTYATEPALCSSMFVAQNDYEVLFINGVEDEWTDNSGIEITPDQLYVLSDARDLVKWSRGANDWNEAHPEVSIFNPNNEDLSLGSAAQGASIPIPARSITRLKVNDQLWVNILNEDLDENFTLRLCDATGRAPFMVRWINAHGGVDTYVFMNNQFFEQDIKTNGARLLPVATGTYLNAKRAYDISAQRSVVCGADNVSNKVYALLETLAKSIHIDYYYDEKAGTYGQSWPYRIVYPSWVPVVVKEYKGRANSGRPIQNFEITLQLPDIKTF